MGLIYMIRKSKKSGIKNIDTMTRYVVNRAKSEKKMIGNPRPAEPIDFILAEAGRQVGDIRQAEGELTITTKGGKKRKLSVRYG